MMFDLTGWTIAAALYVLGAFPTHAWARFEGQHDPLRLLFICALWPLSLVLSVLADMALRGRS